MDEETLKNLIHDYETFVPLNSIYAKYHIGGPLLRKTLKILEIPERPVTKSARILACARRLAGKPAEIDESSEEEIEEVEESSDEEEEPPKVTIKTKPKPKAKAKSQKHSAKTLLDQYM